MYERIINKVHEAITRVAATQDSTEDVQAQAREVK